MNNVLVGLFWATCIHRVYISTKRVQSRILVTENKLGHWDTIFEGDYDNPPKSSEHVTHGKGAHTGSGSLYV
jgi:hypothetical protein